MNWSDLCVVSSNSTDVFTFTYLQGDDLSPCFQLLLQGGASVLLFFASICYFFNYIGYRKQSVTRIPMLQTLAGIRCWLCILISLLVIATDTVKAAYAQGNNDINQVLYYIVLLFTSLAWLAMGAMSYTLRFVMKSSRGPVVIVILYALCAILFCIAFRSVVMQPMATHEDVLKLLYSFGAVCHILLCASFIPSARDTDSYTLVVNDDANENTSLLGNNGLSYRTFAQRPSQVGETGSVFSKLVFWWVNPLMKKGKKGQIRNADDVFLLPKRLGTESLSSMFQDKLCQADAARLSKGKPTYTLMSSLHKAFGVEYYCLGILKLLADGLGFAGPLLLNALISYMENPSEVRWHGYLYAAGMFLSTLTAALLTAHFDFNVNSITIKLKTAVVSSVYRKMLAVNSVELSRFTSGETVNFMSTDVDRLVNFCGSFHQFWSLPFQIGVSLFLLYQQVGWCFLAGLVFAILLIPVNRKIAMKIGDLSTKMMGQKDKRVKTMNELIYGIRVVKLLAWEKFFVKRVTEQRQAELASLKGRKYLDALCVYFWATTPVLISILTFTLYSLLGNQLTASKVFTSLALLNMLIGPLNAFPWVVNGLVESWVSLKRIQQFINLRHHTQMEFWSDNEGSMLIQNGSFTWQPDSPGSTDTAGPLALSHINIDVKEGMLVGVIGKVGSGKSSLIHALLHEMNLTHPEDAASSPLSDSSHSPGRGNVQLGTRRGVGLVSQHCWVQQGTVRDNVLMGQRMDLERYTKTLSSCALTDDLKVFPEGDKMQVGENGVNLSGGQKARLTLARAIYQDFDLYLLDDPLAAVDAKVARHIFDRCIMGLLGNKARILCTHHIDFLWKADIVIVMSHGRIVQAGKPQEILPSLTSVIKSEHTANSQQDETGQVESLDNEEGLCALVEEEQKDVGNVKLRVFKMYAVAVGKLMTALILLSMLFMQGSKNVTDWWLSYWISHVPKVHNGTYPSADNTTFYLEVYGGLAGANTIFTLVRAFLFAYGGIRAACCVHSDLLKVVVKARMSFFDNTATGRIMNRFSSDVYTVDDSLPFIANILLSQTFSILGTIAITIYGLPWFVAVLIPLSLIYYYIQRYYRETSRELKRITSVTMSEVYSHLSESVEGRIVIRAFNQMDRFERENLEKLDRNQRAQFSSVAAVQWLNIRLQGLGVVMVTAIAFIAVLEHSFRTVDPGLVGLAISYALSITNLLTGVVSSFADTEKQMVSVERVEQYIEGIEPESTEQHEEQVDDSWPSRGRIQFTDVKLRYKPSLPYVLNGISLDILPGEKIGIVGRTGSGKSSLFNTLFRMVDTFEGVVCIDGLNISHIPLQTLRSRMAVIPQSPFLFSGSLRENLDPFHIYSDDAIWQALSKCHMADVASSLGGLHVELAERGRLFSAGQSQLLCLARAMLVGSKVLCIDEATAHVDLDTDKAIQETIREAFVHCTVLTVAHRISTVLQCDRILVMSRGAIAEFGVPSRLLEDENSLLSSIIKDQTHSS